MPTTKTARKASAVKGSQRAAAAEAERYRSPLIYDQPSTLQKSADVLRRLRSEPLKIRLDYWHKAAALVTGAISMSYSGTGISKRVLLEWSKLLRAVADDIEKTVNQPK